MSRNINVNPDHYKVAGRERQGESIHHERNKREEAMAVKARARQRRKASGPSARRGR